MTTPSTRDTVRTGIKLVVRLLTFVAFVGYGYVLHRVFGVEVEFTSVWEIMFTVYYMTVWGKDVEAFVDKALDDG
jgi:hypothetical protein